MTGVKGQVQARGVERRAQIVAAATRLFAGAGYRGTGLAAIAAEVGVTAPAIVHHFGSKEGLLRAVIEAHDREVAAGFLARLAASPGDGREPGALASLRAMVHDAEASLRAPRLAALYLVLMTENLDADAPIHDFFVARARALRRLFARLLRRGVARGELAGPIDAAAKAAEIVAFMEGAQLQWLLDPGRVDLVALYRGYFDGLARALAAPVAGGPGERRRRGPGAPARGRRRAT